MHTHTGMHTRTHRYLKPWLKALFAGSAASPPNVPTIVMNCTCLAHTHSLVTPLLVRAYVRACVRVHACMCVCMRTGGNSYHCNCYTQCVKTCSISWINPPPPPRWQWAPSVTPSATPPTTAPATTAPTAADITPAVTRAFAMSAALVLSSSSGHSVLSLAEALAQLIHPDDARRLKKEYGQA